MLDTDALLAPASTLNTALRAMTGRLAGADLLAEQAFLQVGRQVEDGHRRALSLVELATQALQLDAGETSEQTVARPRQLTEHGATWLAVRLQQRSEELTGNFSELVAALQFQDITRQRLRHIRQALRGLERANAGETVDDAAIAEICQLQHDQLQLAIHEFCGALVLLDENLLGMAGNVQALAEDTCAALLAGSNQESARIATIGEQAVTIGYDLQAARAGIDIRRQFLAQVEPVLAELLTRVRDHGGAARMAGDNRPLDDLQKHYTMMSERVVHQRFLRQHVPPRHNDGRATAESATGCLGDNVELFRAGEQAMTEWSYDDEQRAGKLQVDGVATVAQVGQLKELLIKAIDQAELVLVDLGRVNQVDIAGLQLFCAAHRHAGAHGKVLKLYGGGGQFRDLVRAAGFAHGAWCSAREKTPCLWAELA